MSLMMARDSVPSGIWSITSLSSMSWGGVVTMSADPPFQTMRWR